MKFVKMHGTGNDFILIDSRKESLEGLDLAKFAIKLCDRHYGIGADGLLVVYPSKSADARMKVVNSDGSEAEMCGNGIRCFAKYLFETAEPKKEIFSIETAAGVIIPSIIQHNGRTAVIEVDMGEPHDIKPASVKKYDATLVSMGNPHCVIFVKDLNAVKLDADGPEIENMKMFPNRTNVEFVKVENRNEITVRVWERGAGETLACGTGACASVVAAVNEDLTAKDVLVHLPGGNLEIEWQADGHVILRGPAETVFEGDFVLQSSSKGEVRG
jgi:diaminopimelate epimerase